MSQEPNKISLPVPVKDRHKIVPASYLVLIRDKKILLARRFQTGYEDGKYSLPAGHVDQGESFTETLIREVKEEIGVTLKQEDVHVAHVMHRKALDSERVDVFFVAEQWQGTPEIKEPDKCDDLSWFSLDRLPENTIPYVRHALEAIQHHVFYGEEGF